MYDKRPPLVLLHGLTYDHRQWGPLLRELEIVDPGRRTLALDLPGHGTSPRRASYRSDEVTGLIHDAVTEAGFDAPVVVGHSLGGVLAGIYGAAHPVRGVVNVDQPLLPGRFQELLRDAEPLLRSDDWEQLWRRLTGGMHIDLLPPEAQELVLTATTPRKDLLLGYWEELLATPAADLVEQRAGELVAIRERGVPYHHVSGGEVSAEYRSWLTRSLPDAVVTEFPDSGHFPHLARPAALAEILSDLAG